MNEILKEVTTLSEKVSALMMERQKEGELLANLFEFTKELAAKLIEQKEEMELQKINTDKELENLKERVKILEEEKEWEERRKKRNNLIVIMNKDLEVKESVDKLFVENLNVKCKTKSVKVKAKTKMEQNIVLVEMEDFCQKLSVLQNKYKLKNLTNKVFIQQDMTKKERLDQKIKREEWKRKRQDSERLQDAAEPRKEKKIEMEEKEVEVLKPKKKKRRNRPGQK